MADRALADLTPAEVLQVALDRSTTEQRCDEAWVAALAARVRTARADVAAPDELTSSEHAAVLFSAESAVRADAPDVPPLAIVLLEYDRRGGEVQRNEAMLALLRHYLIKAAFRVGRPDLAKQVWSSTPIGDVEHVGEQVLAELERLRARLAELEAIERRADETSTWCGESGMHRAITYIRTGSTGDSWEAGRG